MKSIEQLLKSTIETAISAYTALNYCESESYPYTVQLTNDIHFHDAETTKNIICGIFKSGEGTRSNIPGFNALVKPFVIDFEVEANFSQLLIGYLEQYIQATNAVVSTVTDTLETDATADDITYSYKIEWGSPLANPTVYDALVKSFEDGVDNESVQMMRVLMRGVITYSADQSLNDRTVYVETSTFAWDASNQSTWNTYGTVNGAYDVVSNVSGASSNLNAATDSHIGGRVFFNNAYSYYVSNGFQPLNGITSFASAFAPVFTATQGNNSYAQTLGFESYSTIFAVTFTRDKADTVHKSIANIPYRTVNATTPDLTMRIDVTSMNVSSEFDAKILDLQTAEQNGFETVSVKVRKV